MPGNSNPQSENAFRTGPPQVLRNSENFVELNLFSDYSEFDPKNLHFPLIFCVIEHSFRLSTLGTGPQKLGKFRGIELIFRLFQI